MPPSHVARNLRLLQAFWFLREAQLWIPVWVVFLTLERGFSYTEVLGAEALYLVAIVFLEVPTGAVADRWGRSRSLGAGAFCLGLAVLIFAWADTFTVLMVSFMLWSLAHTLMSGADMALLFDTLREAGRESEFEVAAGRAFSLIWAGVAVATIAGGPVADWVSAETTIYVGAVTCAITAGLALLIKEPPHRRDAEPEPYFQGIRAAFREVNASAELRAIVLLAGIAGAAVGGMFYLIQPYLIDRGVEVGIWFSWLQVPVLAAGIVGGLFAGRVANAQGMRMLTLLPLAGAVGLVLTGAAPGLIGFAVLPLVAVIQSIFEPIANGAINRRTGSERRATVLSIMGMTMSFAMACVALSIGWLADNPGVTWGFYLCAAVAVAAVLLIGLPAAASRARTATAGAVSSP